MISKKRHPGVFYLQVINRRMNRAKNSVTFTINSGKPRSAIWKMGANNRKLVNIIFWSRRILANIIKPLVKIDLIFL
jgi:hypothetical protein